MVLILFLFGYFRVPYFYIIFLMLQQRSVGGEYIAKEDQDADIKKAWLVLKCSHVICVYSRCIIFK